MDEILRVREFAEKINADCVIGMGGGKVLDTARSATFKAGVPAIIVPTIAASDAPCSCESMIYNEAGEVVDFEVFPKNPDLVLVDSSVIAQAPSEILVAGMGDAAATFFEARTCYENGLENLHGTHISETACAMAKRCYEILLEHG